MRDGQFLIGDQISAPDVRLQPTAFRSSQVRCRFTGIIGGEPVELLDWTDNVSPSAHQETIVILAHRESRDREPAATRSLIAGVPLGSREVRFQPGEMAFIQSLFSLRDAARDGPLKSDLRSFAPSTG